MKTISELCDSDYPAQCRFVGTYEGQFQLINGGTCNQQMRMFRLADSLTEAKDSILSELNSSFKNGNTFSKLHVEACSNAAVYTLGYFRFGGSRDIRKTTLTQITITP